jgi:HK97 family phage prohead protease
MPYYITNKNADCSGWAVIDQAGDAFGCHKTKSGAIDQAIAISLSDDEPFMGERAGIDTLNVGDYVSWDVLNPEILAEVFMIDGEYAVLKLYEFEDGIFHESNKLMILNIFKLERIPKPEFVTQEMPHDKPNDIPDDSPDQMRKADGDPIILSDIDGTLLNGGNRNERVWEYIQSLDGALFILTGRPESQRTETEQDLANADITYSRLIMNDGSTADSPEYKKAKAEELLNTYNIVVAIENNAQTLRYFRELGIDAYSPDSVPSNENRAINQEAPAYMRVAARRGLEYYADGKGGDGLVERTIREAREMADGNVSDDKWIRIAAWIARHLGDLDSPDADPSSDNYPSAGVVAHLLWGSGPTKRAAERTLAYAESVVARIRAEQERDAMTVDVRDKWLDVAYRIKSRLEGEVTEGRSTGKQEQRVNTADFEIRETPAGMTFEGYAAVFNSDSQPLPFIERIAPGAFKRSLQSRNEVKLLWNHDSGEPLASLRGGTLKLTEDDRGLKVSATLASTTRGRDVAELIRSKTIDSMSFGFSVIKDTWNGDVRTLNSVRLYEVSIVSSPAYEATAGTVSVRSTDGIDADKLAEGLMRLESGEELSADDAALINDVVSRLTKTEEVQQVEGDILALKQKKLALLLKGI